MRGRGYPIAEIWIVAGLVIGLLLIASGVIWETCDEPAKERRRFVSKPNELRDAVFLAFPDKTSELAAEIARLMREGTAESRKKAQRLFQASIGAPMESLHGKNGGA